MIRAAVVIAFLAAAPALASPASPGEAAPDFVISQDDHSVVHLSDLRGRVVLVDFWASWCKPCRIEFPVLVELYEKHNDHGLEIVAVNLDTDRKKADAFLKRVGGEPPFVIAYDPDHATPPLYALEGMPTTVLVDRAGIVRSRHTGFRKSDRAEYEREIAALLAEDVAEDAAEDAEDAEDAADAADE
jgi:thiol-disulfide isomerase/thioredoxin